MGEQTQHALFQLTGALRHIAAGDGALPLFVTTNCIPIMCKVCRIYSFLNYTLQSLAPLKFINEFVIFRHCSYSDETKI